MKKTIKILVAIIFAFILFSFGNKVEANSIQSISMDIYVDDRGDAHVTETWKCTATQGTEVYHPYYNLGNSVIKDLMVSEGNTQYTTLSRWDTSGTLASKANKCGINKISDGVELCWGISEYGSHTYTAKYTITNFVSETTDSQMIYWTLIPYDFSTSIGNMYIKIHTNFRIQDTIDVWGYGNYGGTAYVYDGYIEMQSDGRLDTDEYMTILVKFPIGTFNASNKLNNNFEYYYDMAEEGATEYVEPDDSVIIVVILFVAIFFTTIIVAVAKGSTSNKLDYGTAGKKIPKNVQYFRDIPCRNDIFRAYYIGYQYDLIKNKTDILGAIILKWIKDRVIRIEEKEAGVIFKKENIIIVLNETNPEIFEDYKERELFGMLFQASKDGRLENKEFEMWCKDSYSTILFWFDKIIYEEEKKLVREGLIRETERYSSKRKATTALKKEAMELAGFKRYLNEYTLIKERETVEVQLFEEYLIFAQVLGIAQKVAKQFKDIYPEIIEQSNFTSYDYINYINVSSHRGITAARNAKAIAESYSSGGGGFSSGGGGGGSFGGGGGGRRLPLKITIISVPMVKVSRKTCQKKELRL